MRTLLIFISLVMLADNSDAQYVFTGNGAWSDVSNWQNGLKPGLTLPTTGTISIQGTATTTTNTFVDFSNNKGTITIESTGSLTLSNSTQFMNEGSFIVYGTFINRTVWENYMTASVIVYGIVKIQNRQGILPGVPHGFTNRGLVRIKSNGYFTTETSQFINSCLGCQIGDGVLEIETGGTFSNMYISNFFGNLLNQGTLINTGFIKGQPVITGNLINSGTIAPGASPGVYTLTGNYTANASSVHDFEVGGTTTTQYDRLNASGTVALSGTLNVSLINGFSPTTPHDLPIITGSNITGSFSAVNIPSASEYQLVYTPTSVMLRKQSILPVKFESFEGSLKSSGTQLKWKVSTEENVDRYEVEKSSDGNIFHTIGEVRASGQNVYTFIDADNSSNAIYRIKAVDFDDKISISVMIKIDRDKSSVILKAFPVPAKNELIIQHPLAEKGSSISISGLDGKIVLRTIPKEGTQQSILDISGFAKGMYIIRFEDKLRNVEVMKIQKQ